jgi:hypothetical protein
VIAEVSGSQRELPDLLKLGSVFETAASRSLQKAPVSASGVLVSFRSGAWGNSISPPQSAPLRPPFGEAAASGAMITESGYGRSSRGRSRAISSALRRRPSRRR